MGGSGLARDGIASVHQTDRGVCIAGKPAPTVAMRVHDYCGPGLDISQCRDQNRLDGVHAVFSLLKGDVDWGLEHFLGHFDAVFQVWMVLGHVFALWFHSCGTQADSA